MHEMGWPSEHLPTSGPRVFPKAKSRTTCRAAFHSPQLLCRWTGSGHWEWTRKYQWALLGLITHSKGMTSISSDFLGTCLQLEHPGPLSRTERLLQRPRAGEGKCRFGSTRPGHPRRTQSGFPFIKLGCGPPSPGMTRGGFLYQFSLVVSPSSAHPPLTANEGRTPA